jgi:hypothetical protein
MLSDLFFASESRGWAIGSTFGINQNWEMYWKAEMLKTSNGGLSWSIIPTELSPFEFLEARIFFVENTGFAISDYGHLHKSTNSGATWTELNFGAVATDIYFSDPENGRAVGNNGAIFQTADGGNNWIQEQSPTGYTFERILFTESGDGWIFGANSTILHLADSTMVSVKEPVSPELINVSVYPNPFSGSTAISYELYDACYTSVKVYNYSGQLVTELVNEWQSEGWHKVSWNAENMPAGIYLYRLSAGNLVSTNKVEKIK